LYGGVGRFNTYSSPRKLFYVKDIDWAEIEMTNYSQDMILETDFPKPRAYHTLTLLSDTKAILYGGVLESALTTQNDPHLYEFDLSLVNKGIFSCKRIEKVYSINIDADSGQYILPKARAHHGACSINPNELYIFGGYSNASWNSTVLSDLWLFNYKDRIWKLISSSSVEIRDAKQEMYKPLPRYGHIMVGSKKHNKLFVIGGCSKKGEPYKEIICFDLNTNQWSLCSIIPKSIIVNLQLHETIPDIDIHVSQQSKMVPAYIPARYGSACIFDDFIFITGGETMESGISPICDDVLVYNVITHSLLKCQIPSAETYISHHSSIIRNGRLMLFGGKLGWNRYNSAVMASITSLVRYPVFGIPLQDACRLTYYQNDAQNVTEKLKVPDIVDICVEYILLNGLTTKNIFNNNISRDQIIRLRLHFEHGNVHNVQFLQQDKDCTPDAVGQLLIEYFASLPDCLFTTELYRSWLDAYIHNEDKTVLIDIYHDLIDQLPYTNRIVMRRLLSLLHQIVINEDNSVTANMLSQIWSHTLLKTNIMNKYSVKDDFQDGKGMSPVNYCIAWIFINYPKLFK
jgi:hypothetical protein